MSLLRVLRAKDTNMQVGDPVSNVVIFQDFHSTKTILSCDLLLYKTKRCAVFRKFLVISRRFAVFLCYPVWCLYEFLYGLLIFVPPKAPLILIWP